jgi:hypothetical protein
MKKISSDEVNRIIKECKQIREKAFFTFIRQSGLTPDQTKQLRIKHLENILDPNPPIPCAINQPSVKSPPAFIAHEAVKYLKLYLGTRNNLTHQSPLFASRNDSTKQINTHNMSTTFTQTARRLLKQRKITHKIKLYDLVSFYRTNAKSYLKEHASPHSPNDVEFWRKQYKEKAMPFLELEPPTPMEIYQLKDAINEIIQQTEEPEIFLTEEELEQIQAGREEWEKQEKKREQWLNEHPEERKKQEEEWEKDYQDMQEYLRYLKEHPEIEQQWQEQTRKARLDKLEKALEQFRQRTQNIRQ